jgi:hypothetical protein
LKKSNKKGDLIDKKLPNNRKFGIILYLREKLEMQRECRIPKNIKREGHPW